MRQKYREAEEILNPQQTTVKEIQIPPVGEFPNPGLS